MILNIIAVFVASLFFISFFRNKIVKGSLSILASLFLCLEISSLYLSGQFIDYQYVFHFNITSLRMADGFVYQIFIFFISLIGISALFYFLSGLTDKISPSSLKKYRWYIIASKTIMIIASIVVLLSTREGIYDGAKEVYFVMRADADVPDGIFIDKKDLEVSCKGKNIIIISLESFEKAFLHESNKTLSPNLRELKNSWTYYDMHQNEGSNWTIASLYTALTGMPGFFPGLGNLFFRNTKDCRLVSVIDILNKCNYESYHLSVDPDFAGTDSLLESMGVEQIQGGTFNGKYEELNFKGTSDKNIFAEAKEILSKKGDRPIFLYLSTTQMHAPDGYIDNEMLQFVEKLDYSLKTATLSTDWLVEDFISFLNNKNLLENSAVYIYPDHLFMSKDNRLINNTGERGLWMMTNVEKDKLPIDTSNFYQIDLPRIILAGAEVKHNFVFMADTIKEDKSVFINKNKALISAINFASTRKRKE